MLLPAGAPIKLSNQRFSEMHPSLRTFSYWSFKCLAHNHGNCYLHTMVTKSAKVRPMIPYDFGSMDAFASLIRPSQYVEQAL